MSKERRINFFPATPEQDNYLESATLRDWFAGQALAGELASQSKDCGEWSPNFFNVLSERCFEIADAMLKEREK